MLAYISFVNVPTADTPGTLAYLHFDDRRYLIGTLAEGSTRVCTDRGVSLRKVSDVFLTGRTRWSNVGGLLGMVLSLADTKTASLEASQEHQRGKSNSNNTRENLDKSMQRLNIHGGPNLNHMIATARRFIFRTGMPINAMESAAEEMPSNNLADDIEPTYVDERIKVWTMPILPDDATDLVPSRSLSCSSKKRTFEEANGLNSQKQDHKNHCTDIVRDMFDSTWRFDRLVPRKLSEVRMPAACFVKDAQTGQLVKYEGPKPGGDRPVPDMTVIVREPWPGSNIQHLSPTIQQPESICYIMCTYPQRGKFLPGKAKELNVPKGKLWSQLATGESVRNDRGEVVTPSMVLEPGQPGFGCAFVELPNSDYIEPCLIRPEWKIPTIVESLAGIVWILGPGVGADVRLKNFQDRMSHLKHYVSSTDYTENHIGLESAATNALRHNHIDDELFPLLHSSALGDPSIKLNELKSDLPLSLPVQSGHRFMLHPNVGTSDTETLPPMDIPAMKQKVAQAFDMFPEIADGINKVTTTHESETWLQSFPHGDVEILVLGTGSSHPSKYRNVSGTVVRIPDWGSILLDAGEGTINTLRRMVPEAELQGLLADLRVVWISHLHADHHLGLTSVIEAWSSTRATKDRSPLDATEVKSRNEDPTLTLISSEPMSQWLHEYSSVEKLDLSHVRTLATKPSPPPDVAGNSGQTTKFFDIASKGNTTSSRNIEALDCLSSLGLTQLNSVYVNHCHGAQAVSITFPSGFKLSYSGDCRPSSLFANIGRDSHLLIHEATFEDDMRSEALAKRHSTVGEALIVGDEMRAKVTLLTHFSQRYPAMPPLGVDITGTLQALGTTNLKNVLEGHVVTQQEASIGETTTDFAHGANGESSQRESAQGKTEIYTEKASLIDQADIQRLIDESGMKVAFAFDYMRLKLKNIPTLERKQPLLRKMYDLEIGKDLMLSGDESQNGGPHNSNKAKKKQ